MISVMVEEVHDAVRHSNMTTYPRDRSFHYSQCTKSWAMKHNMLWTYYFSLSPTMQWLNWKQEWTCETFVVNDRAW